MFRPRNDMRTLIVLFVLVPFVHQLGEKMWFIYKIKLDIGGYDVWQEQTVGECAGRILTGEKQESVVLLMCSEGLPYAPGSLGSCTGIWFNYRFNKSCFSAFGFLYTSWYTDHSAQCCVLGHSSSSKLVEPSGFTVRLHPEPSHGSRLSRGETRWRRGRSFPTPLLKSNTDHIH